MGQESKLTWYYSSLLAGLGVLYGSILSCGFGHAFESLITNVSTAGFILLNILILVRLFRAFSGVHTLRLGVFMAIAIAAPLGMLLSSAIFDTTEKLFWVSDSIYTHHPSSEYVASLLDGTNALSQENIMRVFRPGVFTHLWVGAWYALFGSSAVVSVIALLIVKGITVELLSSVYRRTCSLLGFDGRAPGIEVVVLYLSVPTVLFHTIVLYKEAIVHLFFTVTLLGCLSMIRRPKLSAVPVIICGVLGLFIERFYVAASCLPLLAYLTVLSFKNRKIGIATLTVAGTAALTYFLGIENFTPSEFLSKIEHQRQYHSSLPGVSQKINYEIPYIVAFIKMLLTPIWAPNKLSMFHGFSALVTWGSFVHQVVISAYLLCVAHLFGRQLKFKFLILHVPFLIFLLFGAYISPWAGRVRDSYFPLIAVFATIYLIHYARRDLEMLRSRFGIVRGQ